MTHDRETWLQSIRSNLSDWQAMLVFADWLEEEGDLLAAEQWRWIAAHGWRHVWARDWPHIKSRVPLFPIELKFANKNKVRCMQHYPQTIEDVQAYFSQLESIDSR